jgi:uncharacterized membrane protein YqjE
MIVHESRRADEPDTGRGIFALIEELLGKTTRLLDQKLMLLRLEVEDSVGQLLRHLGILLVGGILAGLGLVLASIAVALWVGNRLGSTLGGFAVTGAGFLIVGTVLAAVRLQRGVGPKRLVPERTVKELEKDTRWIKSAH